MRCTVSSSWLSAARRKSSGQTNLVYASVCECFSYHLKPLVNLVVVVGFVSNLIVDVKNPNCRIKYRVFSDSCLFLLLVHRTCQRVGLGFIIGLWHAQEDWVALEQRVDLRSRPRFFIGPGSFSRAQRWPFDSSLLSVELLRFQAAQLEVFVLGQRLLEENVSWSHAPSLSFSPSHFCYWHPWIIQQLAEQETTNKVMRCHVVPYGLLILCISTGIEDSFRPASYATLRFFFFFF